MKVLEYVDRANAEHKGRIIKATRDLAEQLCSESDTHCDYVKSEIVRWISENGSRDKATERECNNEYKNRARGNEHILNKLISAKCLFTSGCKCQD